MGVLQRWARFAHLAEAHAVHGLLDARLAEGVALRVGEQALQHRVARKCSGLSSALQMPSQRSSLLHTANSSGPCNASVAYLPSADQGCC